MSESTAWEHINAGALVVANHSGGKDSQSMLIHLLASGVPRDQIVVVHAALGRVEWPGALELAQKQAADAGVPFMVARAGKDLLGMVERRFETRPEVPSWPSSATRQCTSDLKRGPIQREVRRYADEHGFRSVVNAMGFRAEESASRAKRGCWTCNKGQTNTRRTWFDWLPIHSRTVEQVWQTIRDAGQEPHPAYRSGNDRLSCVFCIMGCPSDLANGARHHPDLYQEYLDLEERTGYTMHMSRMPLRDLVEKGLRELESGKPKQGTLFSGEAA